MINCFVNERVAFVINIHNVLIVEIQVGWSIQNDTLSKVLIVVDN